MKIESSRVDVEAAAWSLRQRTVEERLRVWDGAGGATEVESHSEDLELRASLSTARIGTGRWPRNPVAAFAAGERLAHPSRVPVARSEPPAARPPAASRAEEPELETGGSGSASERLRALILRMLFDGEGEPTGLLRKALEEDAGEEITEAREEGAVQAGEAAAEIARGGSPEGSGPGLRYTRVETRVEADHLSFAARGEVVTADGRSLAFEVSFERTHLSAEQTRLELRLGRPEQMKDPLLLDLSGLASLTAESIALDLDGDGSLDALPTLSGGAWLARDLDGDGRVGDRAELFGPTTGDAFAELALLDGDGNGWIDEGDAAWQQLATWNGGELTSLAAAGVGAIGLAHADGDFAERVGGELVGQTRATGVYLTEAGAAGTARQVDVVG